MYNFRIEIFGKKLAKLRIFCPIFAYVKNAIPLAIIHVTVNQFTKITIHEENTQNHV